MTILEALNWGREEIKKTLHEKAETGHNPMIDAQILLSFCLKKPTSFLFSHFEEEIQENVSEKYQRLIQRRANHEPVSYITGEKEFYGRQFKVNQFVLIPRPETEMIIDEIKKNVTENTLLADVGTGSGAIAITLALETGLPIVATEIDKNSLAVALHNAEKHKVKHLISFQQGNLLAPYFEKNINESAREKMIIAANLPYAKIGVWQSLDPDVQKFEPKHAIVGGVDGLDLYDSLLSQIRTNIKKLPNQIHLLFEIDPSQELSIVRLIREYFENAEVEILNDLARKPRLVTVKIIR